MVQRQAIKHAAGRANPTRERQHRDSQHDQQQNRQSQTQILQALHADNRGQETGEHDTDIQQPPSAGDQVRTVQIRQEERSAEQDDGQAQGAADRGHSGVAQQTIAHRRQHHDQQDGLVEVQGHFPKRNGDVCQGSQHENRQQTPQRAPDDEPDQDRRQQRKQPEGCRGIKHG